MKLTIDIPDDKLADVEAAVWATYGLPVIDHLKAHLRDRVLAWRQQEAVKAQPVALDTAWGDLATPAKADA